MKPSTSRRDFLQAGLALPVVGLAARTGAGKASVEATPAAASPFLDSSPQLTYRILGKTGLKVTTVGFGCMITSDGSVIERAADMGITYFDTARVYQNGNNERMVGAALKNRRKNIVLSSKTGAPQPRRRARQPRYQPQGARHGLSRHLVSARQGEARRHHRRADRRAANRQPGGQDPLRRREHAQGPAHADPLPRRASQDRRDSLRLQLHPGACRQRGIGAGGQGRQGHRGHEGDGGRFSPPEGGRSQLSRS